MKQAVGPARRTAKPTPPTEDGIPGAAAIISVYVVLLWAIPSQLTFAPLGSIGRLATLLGLGALGWWVLQSILRPRRNRDRQPVRTAYAVFLCVVLISYAVAQAKGLPTDEVSPADSAVVRVMSLGGVLLLANDGIFSRESLHRLLQLIATLGGLVALLGLAQFVTGEALIDRISIPGMTAEDGLGGYQERSGFVRASATATHPLEYAAVLAAALPLAIPLAFYDRQRTVLRRAWPAVAIAAASIVSVSRSAILGLAVSVIILMPALDRTARRVLSGGGLLMLVGAYVTVPGLMGTIRGLFISVGTDSSIQSRTGAMDAAGEVVPHNLWLGRGLGTFMTKYFILDNQLLLFLIEVGIIGLLAFLSIAGWAVLSSIRARRRAANSLDAALYQGLAASICATVILYSFFDGLSFPMAAGTFFLMAGVAGAAANFTRTWGPGGRGQHD